MTDLLRIGTSSLLNMQQAINTVGHNITNVNTAGYSRQSVTFEARGAQSYGFGYLGNGAYVSGVNRAANDFLTSQIHTFTASESRYSTLVTLTSRLDSLVADADNSLNTSLQSFFNAVQDVATNPASVPERHVLLSDATNLVSRVEALNGRLASLAGEVDTQVSTLLRDINTLVKNLGAVNSEIVSAVSAAKGNPPNDLLDYRDQLLTQLADKVGISVVQQQDGSVNVFAGQGQALVVGSEVNQLATQPNAYDASRLDIVIKDSPGATPINRSVTGGALQAALEFRDGTLRQAQSQLGLIALGLSASFNAVHEQGIDLDGNTGGRFFADISLGVAASSRNKGTALPALTLEDASAVRASDYRLEYDGAQWTCTRMSDGTQVSGTGTLDFDGMRLALPATGAQKDDSFQFNPALQAGGQFALALKDPAQVAAALEVDAVGDNGNALKLAELQFAPLLNGGKDTLQQFYGTLVATVGLGSREAQSNLSLETSLLDQAQQYRDSLSGVNLDEEAANLLRYQQAYQASAQIIKIADETFRTLLGAMG